jgi:hypothetical protein
MNAQPVSTPSTLVKKAVRKIRKSYLFKSHLPHPTIWSETGLQLACVGVAR